MYIRTEIEPEQRLGLAPFMSTLLKKAGEVVFEQVVERGLDWILSPSPEGIFTSKTNEVSVYRPNPPPFHRCSLDFPLTARIPGKSEQDFWFQIIGEYNGNDLKHVKILPLFAKTGEPKGRFDITFKGAEYDDPRIPVEFATVAKVKFLFDGTWKPHSSSTSFTFDGFVVIWGNGPRIPAGVQVLRSEKDMVSSRDLKPGETKGCPTRRHTLPPAPVVPKPPVQKPVPLVILFPFNKDTVSESDAPRIYQWVNSWPSTTRAKVARGEMKVTVAGFASRPGKGLYNLALSERRAKNVKTMLGMIGGFSDSKTWFEIRPHGKYSQNLLQGLLRVFDPNKFDQAALIYFEDVE